MFCSSNFFFFSFVFFFKLCQAGIRIEMYSLHSMEIRQHSAPWFVWNRFVHRKIRQAVIVKEHSNIYLDWVSTFNIILFFLPLTNLRLLRQAKMSCSQSVHRRVFQNIRNQNQTPPCCCLFSSVCMEGREALQIIFTHMLLSKVLSTAQ